MKMSVPVAVKSEEIVLENAEYNSADELEEEFQLQLEDTGGESYIQYHDDSQYATAHRQRNQSSIMNSKDLSTGSGGGVGDGGGGGSGGSTATKTMLESEKRMRREIANSNERRRMQSINAGFQNLRALLPRHEGEKLSKAAILQQTSQYICELEDQKTQLLAQNSQLKRQLGQHDISTTTNSVSGGGEVVTGNDVSGGVAIKKRKLTDNVASMQTVSDSSDEGLGSMSPEPMTLLTAANVKQAVTANLIAQSAAKELYELKKQLEKERRLRTMLEDELQTIKRQLYSVATAPAQKFEICSPNSYIPREVIEHTDNVVRDDDLPAGTVSYVEIDEMTGQQQVVVCTSIEELDSESGLPTDLITEDHMNEEVILSTASCTESEQDVNAIAKAYAEGKSPALLQPILQAAIKATPKVEVERINEAIVKVKTEKIEQPSGLTRSRQNLETIVEAIRHLEGDHLFGDVAEQQKQQQQKLQKAQEAPLALTTSKQLQQLSQRNTLAELRPFLQLKSSKQMTIVGGTSISIATAAQQHLNKSNNVSSNGNSNSGGSVSISGTNNTSSSSIQTATTGVVTTNNNNVQHQKDSQPLVTPTAILKVQTTNSAAAPSAPPQITITSTALKQCRPGVIVAKQLS